jgi:hypothetical protein
MELFGFPTPDYESVFAWLTDPLAIAVLTQTWPVIVSGAQQHDTL